MAIAWLLSPMGRRDSGATLTRDYALMLEIDASLIFRVVLPQASNAARRMPGRTRAMISLAQEARGRADTRFSFSLRHRPREVAV